MQVWKRRVAVLAAVAAGSAGLMMSTASAQTFPFPFPSSSPPPTMPPVTSPPPPTIPSFENQLNDLLDNLLDTFEDSPLLEELQGIVDEIREGFFN